MRRAAIRYQTHLGKGLHEIGFLGRHNHVGHQGKTGPDTGCGPVHRRDPRHRQTRQALDQRIYRIFQPRTGVIVCRAYTFQTATGQIGPRTKPLARTRQDHGPRPRLDLIQNRHQFIHHSNRDRIQGLRIIQSHNGDIAVPFQIDQSHTKPPHTRQCRHF